MLWNELMLKKLSFTLITWLHRVCRSFSESTHTHFYIISCSSIFFLSFTRCVSCSHMCVCLCCIQLGTKTKLKVGNVKWAGNGGNSVVDTWASTTRQTAHQVSLTYVLGWLLLYYKYATAVTRSLMRWAAGRGWAGLSLWDYFGWERIKHTVSREIPIRICLTRKKLGLTSEGTFWEQNKWEIQQQLIRAQGYKQSPWTCLRNRLMFCNEYQPLTLNYNAKQYYLSGRTFKMSYYH